MKHLSKLERNWILYDVGNSAFILMVTTIIPIYFKYLTESAQLSSAQYFSLWGFSTSLVTLIVAVLAPIVGAFSDTKGLKKPIFTLSVLAGVISCIFLGLLSSWLLFLIVFIFAKICYSASLIFYDSMLTDVTTPEHMDMLSSQGYAWGYIGSCIPFVLSLLAVLGYESIGITFETAMFAAFLITGLWWLLFTLPLLKKYRQLHSMAPGAHPIKESFLRIGATLRDIRKEKRVFLFLLAFFFYIDGVYTIIDMATAYGESLGLDSNGLLIALLLTQIVAFPFAILFGFLSRKYQTANLLSICIAAYLCIALYAIQLNSQKEFFLLAICVGMFQGGVQALSRSYYARIIPPEKSGEYFGLFDICGKGASFLGTSLVSLIGSLTGKVNYGVGSLIVLFLIGLFLFRLSIREQTKTHSTTSGGDQL